MFETRGYRGLNIVPYPEHIKDGIGKGLISKKLAYTPGKTKTKHVKFDFTNYDPDLQKK